MEGEAAREMQAAMLLQEAQLQAQQAGQVVEMQVDVKVKKCEKFVGC